MCGIVGLLSPGPSPVGSSVDLGSYASVAHTLEKAAGASDFPGIEQSVSWIESRFDDVMSFDVFNAIATEPGAQTVFARLVAALRAAQAAVERTLREEGPSESLERLNEWLRDYTWQLDAEVIGMVTQAGRLLPDPSRASREQRFVAWSAERVLSALDRLEVRGRDSAGISLLVCAGRGWSDPGTDAPLDETAGQTHTVSQWTDGRLTLRSVHKVANLVGRLGDNGAILRAQLKADARLWSAAAHVECLNIIAHTRWASTGAITLANCHPISGAVNGIGHGEKVMVVANGDVDNHVTLIEEILGHRGLSSHPAVTTDTKALAVAVAVAADAPVGDRLAAVLSGCEGSLAVAYQSADSPEHLAIAQQGSGQALYFGETADGWLVASEIYGLASMCRRARALNTGGGAGVTIHLRLEGREREFAGRSANGDECRPAEQPISIFSRDIFRGQYDYFIEKELAEAPESVRKTITGKYRYTPGGLTMVTSAIGNGTGLAARLAADEQPPIRRILVIGHGTASIAAFGIAHLLRRALGERVAVDWSKASEVIGFAGDGRLDDTLIIAVSQSGTTTDTNRIVDLVRQRGAWVHAIVNRRSSALIQKSQSHLYTSDGRDVEMSVASTKAYYSQIAAGKVLSLFLASHLGTRTPAQLATEAAELDRLPAKLVEVGRLRARIAELTRRWALRSRNWAVVGNGPNRIAAEEIRIKSSELCYKAIPCDVTEDKKHIDLSTEPMTLVIANDIPEEVVQDTVKEVAIFKAHNGRPIVFAAATESRFNDVAEDVVPIPEIGGGLAFVLATAAGHLFAVAAAREMDAAVEPIRAARAEITRLCEADGGDSTQAVLALDAVGDAIQKGELDASLSASLCMTFARHRAAVTEAGPAGQRAALEAMLDTLRIMVGELTRSIDTIRHQAKTVTVGVSRRQRGLAPAIIEALLQLDLTPTDLRDRDREALESISPLVRHVRGAVRYSARPATDRSQWLLHAESAAGASQIQRSRYATARIAEGTKRTALRTEALQLGGGRTGRQDLATLPISRDGQTIGVLLLDLVLAGEAPVMQVVTILRELGSAHELFAERIAEHDPGLTLEDVIARSSPADVIFRGAEWCLRTLGAEEVQPRPVS